MNKSNRILSDITVFMKYAKYIPETKRRETWDQLVFRNESMHIKKFPNLEKEIRLAYEDVYSKNILPSMRSLQFGCVVYNLAVNLSKYLLTGYTIVLTYR